MEYSPPLRKAVFLRRYKRFLADVELDGKPLTVHCPNTGAMTGCMVAGSPCWIGFSDNRQRRYPWTLEQVTTDTGARASINSARANKLVREAIESDVLPALVGWSVAQSEKCLEDGSRLDFWLNDSRGGECALEVKSVTLVDEQGYGAFPDARSVRARKHIQSLCELIKEGIRAALVFCVQRENIEVMNLRSQVDVEYSETLVHARSIGLEVLALACDLDDMQVGIKRQIPILE